MEKNDRIRKILTLPPGPLPVSHREGEQGGGSLTKIANIQYQHPFGTTPT